MLSSDNIKTRRDFLKFTGATVLGMSVLNLSASVLETTKKPNIVWIMAEDLAKHHLRLYDKNAASSPSVEAMAESGLIFENAFCNAPVCSVARSSLITGCYAPRIGTQYHRRAQLVPMPDRLQMFPAYLRNAGYYTTNSTKRDYNCKESTDVWDEPSGKMDAWRNRSTKETPFFHVITLLQTHEGKLHFNPKEVGSDVKSETLKIPPQYPDTELFRYTYARLYDLILDADKEVAKIIDNLKQDGLLEDTFIFYFGDNGGTLPGSKGYLSETGLHVPLVVRVPQNWKHLAPQSPDKRISGFVSFVDFAATMLNLSGLKIPKQMDGRPFLGKGITLKAINKHNETFGSADRFDELYYTSRSLRKDSMKYIRNYEPYLPTSLYNQYRYKMAAFEQWRQLYKQGKLNAAQAKFFEPKGPEELYDLTADPYETVNLANNPKHKSTLKKLRRRLKQHMTDMPDLGIIPECIWLLEGGDTNPVAYGQSQKSRISKYIEVADLMLLTYDKAVEKIKTSLKSNDPLIRYWALTVCAGFGQKAKDMTVIAKTLTEDNDNLVRCRAALFLGVIGAMDPQPIYQQTLRQARSSMEALHILNDLIYLRDGKFGYAFDFSLQDISKTNYDNWGVKQRTEYLGWNS